MPPFANYKTIVVKDGDGKNAKNKAQGGRRVMYTTHHPCWDAKNRDGLADELAFDYAAIAQVIPVPGGASPEPTPPVQQFGTPVRTPAPFVATRLQTSLWIPRISWKTNWRRPVCRTSCVR